MAPYSIHHHQGYRIYIDQERADPAFLGIICGGPDRQLAAFRPIDSSASAHAYRFEYAGRHFFYKRFLHRNWKDPLKGLFRGTRAQRAMRGHLQLARCGFKTPPVVAVGHRPPLCFLVTEYLQGYIGLDHWFEARGLSHGTFRNEKRLMIEWVARLVRRLHDRSLFHGDLGWGNILVKELSPGQWDYAIIDNERTRLSRIRQSAKRIRNLVDLNMTAGTKLSRSDRLCFFKAYMDFPPPLEYPSKNWLKTIEYKTARGLYRKTLKKKHLQAAAPEE